MSLMGKILEACNWRLTVCRGGYVVINGEGPLQALTLLRMMVGMVVTSPDQGLPLVSLFRAMRITIISAEIRAHLARVWVTML